MFDLLFKMLHVHTRWLISLFVFRFDLIVPLWAVVAVSQRCSRSSSNNNSNPRQMVNNHRQCQTTQALCEEKKNVQPTFGYSLSIYHHLIFSHGMYIAVGSQALN